MALDQRAGRESLDPASSAANYAGDSGPASIWSAMLAHGRLRVLGAQRVLRVVGDHDAALRHPKEAQGCSTLLVGP